MESPWTKPHSVCKAKYTIHSHYRPHFKDTEHDNTTCKKTKTIRGLLHWIVSQVLHIPCISISKVTTTCTITEISDHWQNHQPKTQQYGSHYTSRERLTTYQAQIQAVDLCTCCSIQNLLFSWRRTTRTTRTNGNPMSHWSSNVQNEKWQYQRWRDKPGFRETDTTCSEPKHCSLCKQVLVRRSNTQTLLS